MTAARTATKKTAARKTRSVATTSPAPVAPGPGARAFEAVSAAFAGDPRVELGRMFGSPGLKAGGKVFAMLVKDQLVVKLPKQQVDEWVAAGRGEYFDPGHGRLMKEWLSVPAGGRVRWVDLARNGFEFVAGR